MHFFPNPVIVKSLLTVWYKIETNFPSLIKFDEKLLKEIYGVVKVGLNIFSSLACITEFIQIIEGYIFHGCYKFSIFLILFLRITGLIFSQ